MSCGRWWAKVAWSSASSPGGPGATPNPGVRQVHLADDYVVCAVPRGHVWAQRRRITQAEFLRTPMVVRDPGSNARWTVETALSRLEPARRAAPVLECPTPSSARQEALTRNAPLLLSRRVLRSEFFVEVEIERLEFPRSYELVLPAAGEPSGPAKALISRLEAAVARLVAVQAPRSTCAQNSRSNAAKRVAAVGANNAAAAKQSAAMVASGTSATRSPRATNHAPGNAISRPGTANVRAAPRCLDKSGRRRSHSGSRDREADGAHKAEHEHGAKYARRRAVTGIRSSPHALR